MSPKPGCRSGLRQATPPQEPGLSDGGPGSRSVAWCTLRETTTAIPLSQVPSESTSSAPRGTGVTLREMPRYAERQVPRGVGEPTDTPTLLCGTRFRRKNHPHLLSLEGSSKLERHLPEIRGKPARVNQDSPTSEDAPRVRDRAGGRSHPRWVLGVSMANRPVPSLPSAPSWRSVPARGAPPVAQTSVYITRLPSLLQAPQH